MQFQIQNKEIGLFRNQLSYDTSWNDKEHQLTVLFGQEAQENFLSVTRSFTRGFDDKLLTIIPVDLATLAGGLNNPIIATSGAFKHTQYFWGFLHHLLLVKTQTEYLLIMVMLVIPITKNI